MKLLWTIKHLSIFTSGCVAAIGNFDGLHRGHQALLASLRAKAEQARLPSLVILFEPQPREFFQKKQAPPRLSLLRSKLDKLSECGVDFVYCLRFNQRLASMSAPDFAQKIIYQDLKVRCLFVGQDFRFGRDRQGDIDLLIQLGEQANCLIEVYQDFTIGHERVSSTQVRLALQQANFARVKELMGRDYSLCGRVMYGDARGREWGVPTANLKIPPGPLPLKGVFCVQVKRAGYPLFNGVANIGQRPTLDGTKQILEVHLFDFNDLLYGERLEVFFLHKLRDEVKFPSLEALITQIHTDVLSAKTYFLE